MVIAATHVSSFNDHGLEKEILGATSVVALEPKILLIV
jgi:hypothetical protein